MLMSPSGVMISQDKDVEPIVPLGCLGGALGYTMKWSGGVMTLNHPKKGKVEVKIVNGCPQVSKRMALEMIKEIEDVKGMERMMLDSCTKEEEWLRSLVEAHPVLRSLPEWLKDQLPDRPAEDLKKLPGCNRRKRKRMQDGFAVHLYAGPREGYDLGRAFKEIGGDGDSAVLPTALSLL